MKRNLYITSKSEIKRDGNTLRISTAEDSLTIPASVIDNLYLFGRVAISSGARNFILANDGDIYYLSSSGSLNGILSSTKLRSNYAERLRKYQAYGERKEQMVKLFMLEKIEQIEKDTGRSGSVK